MSALAERPTSGVTLQELPSPSESSAVAPTSTSSTPRRITLEVPGLDPWQRPDVVGYMEARLNELLALPPDWDGRRAVEVADSAVETTVNVLNAVMEPRSAPPQFFPLPDGGVQTEWHVGGNSIEIEIDASGEPHVLATTSTGETVAEGVLRPDPSDGALLATRAFLQTLTDCLAR